MMNGLLIAHRLASMAEQKSAGAIKAELARARKQRARRRLVDKEIRRLRATGMEHRQAVAQALETVRKALDKTPDPYLP